MKSIKELFNNVKTKVAESKVSTATKGFFSKISNSKIMTSLKTKIKGFKDAAKSFLGGHQNVKDAMTGDVTNRFSAKFKKFFKNMFKRTEDSADKGSIFAKVIKVVIKVLAIVATVGFAALVIYCIKDVFLYCLMLVATCAAVAICIEFILSIISVAVGSKI
jgi:hypothetical protein